MHVAVQVLIRQVEPSMDSRNLDDMEAPLLESAPLPEKRRSTLLTVCPFILGRAQTSQTCAVMPQPSNIISCLIFRIFSPVALMLIVSDVMAVAGNEFCERLAFYG